MATTATRRKLTREIPTSITDDVKGSEGGPAATGNLSGPDALELAAAASFQVTKGSPQGGEGSARHNETIAAADRVFAIHAEVFRRLAE